ncbi:MAG: radical SAM protein [Candidatus Gastranaerophilales bacterium]|nr:radical SAM protein [Candidatus Gastranaerophilales bacterium]MCM1072712.1 radical SAM protein [Bacteroides sp.]
MHLRVFNILKNTRVEGPGNRYCIWVQGCSHHCKGCQAVHTWSHKGGVLFEVNDIIEDILNQKNIEGVTFLGGEPFEQAEALGVIAEAVQRAGLSVLCFTGGYLEELKQDSKNQRLIDNIDLLIDGPFEIDKVDYSRPWCGSSNQRYHFLTNCYDEEIFTMYRNKVEVNISKNGQVFINGMGDFDTILKKINLKNIVR